MRQGSEARYFRYFLSRRRLVLAGKTALVEAGPGGATVNFSAGPGLAFCRGAAQFFGSEFWSPVHKFARRSTRLPGGGRGRWIGSDPAQKAQSDRGFSLRSEFSRIKLLCD
jgi:hypothetical protein